MRASRVRRALAVAVAAGAMVLSVTAASGSAARSMPTAPRLPAVRADTLAARYAADHDVIVRSERAARRMGDTSRADHLAGLAASGRQFLSFDPRDDGLAVEVLGDLAHADRVVVLVPGSDTTLDTFDEIGTRYASVAGGARTLRAEMHRLAPDTKTAVVAWLGYHAPRTLSRDVVTTARATAGGSQLRLLMGQLKKVNAAAPVTLMCHSYGTVVCGSAVQPPASPAAPLDRLAGIVAVGSPGMGLRSASDIAVRVPVWAGRGADDWIAGVPHTSVHVPGATIGFGTDPVSRGFGARTFDAGSGGHSDYFKPGGLALHNLALISLGHGEAVSHG
ncbi:alpha/beta hydrolase [Streptomyces sp. NPDC093097]|uniref:alpha/beta hydrolase n=1 Tax=Streptomyces sp. NPDC093097 TaxID=3366027 RepID=UPI003811892F